MHRVRDQQGRSISSSKKPRKTNSAGHSQEGKDPSHPNYFTPIASSLAKRRPRSSTQELETVQVSMKTKIKYSEDLINELYHFREFIF
jgi:hypothetical protein